MLNRSVEEGHLLDARGHIAAAAARIVRQYLVVGRMRAQGLDTRQAETCLRTMQQTLCALRQHEELIEEMLAALPDMGPKRSL